MNVLRYCREVLELLMDADVCPEQRELHPKDVDRAKRAVTLAAEGDDRGAFSIAADVAKRWMLDP